MASDDLQVSHEPFTPARAFAILGRGGIKPAALRVAAELLLVPTTGRPAARESRETILVAVVVRLVVLDARFGEAVLSIGAWNVGLQGSLAVGLGLHAHRIDGLRGDVLELLLDGFVRTSAVHPFRVLGLSTLLLPATTCHC